MASTEASAEWSVSVRKKTYTRWINAYCRHSQIEPSFKVEDLFNDLRDGTALCLIMGDYIGESLIKHSTKDCTLERRQMIENVEQVILEVNYDGVHRFSRRPDLIVDGDKEATLELVWWVIFTVQLSIDDNSEGDQLDEMKIREEMLQWVQKGVTPCALQVTDFSTSWSDGKAFCAVIYAYNAETFSYSEVEGEEPLRRLEYAFKFAEETVLVERLLDVEDVAVPVPDEKCILIYLSFLRQKLVFKPEELSMAKVVLKIWEQVSAMNQVELPCLTDKLGNWGPPAQNKVILRQLAQLQELESEFDQFGRKIAALDKKMKWTNQQQLKYEFQELKDKFKQDKEAFDNVMTATKSCCATVEQFEYLMSAERSVASWLDEARGDVESLLALTKDANAHDKARDSLLSIQKAAVDRKPDVDQLLHLAAEFAERRKKVVDILVEYQKTQPKHVPTSSNEGGSSLEEQASKVLQEWEWILNQCITVLQEWFMIVLTWKLDEDFSSRKEKREAFLHSCNSVFDVLIRISGTCTSASGLKFPALRKKKEDANQHWISICTESETEIARRIDAKAEEELRELNHWVEGCLEDLSSQRPLADTLEGVKIQKQWYQKFLQLVAEREPEVLRYETLHLTGLYQPAVMCEASEIKKEYYLLGEQWMKLQQQKLTWSKLLDSCEAAWERCHATEGELCSLEKVQAQWDPPAVNHNIVAQLKEMETFRTSRVVPFKSKVSAMTDLVDHLKSLGGHPPVEELCRSVSERYDWLVSSLDKLCAATQAQENLISRWRALLATAQALLEWTKEMREKLSKVITDKDRFGVEDHLATCEDLKEAILKKAVEFGQFQGVAASFEAEARGQGWDTEVVTAKNAEVQQSRVSLSDFIDKTQAELQAVADKLKDLLNVVTDKQAWLKEFAGRLMKWRPCLGDVSIVTSEFDMAKELLAEAHAHDKAIKHLTDNADFAVEYSRQCERKPTMDAIVDIRQRHADLKQHLQDKVSQCRSALPLWKSFVATTTEIASWMEGKEKLLSSPSMQPPIRVGEEDELAKQIKSMQRELADGNAKLQLLKSLETDLTEVCDMEEDKAYIAKKCADLRAQYNQLVKMARDALALCNIRERQKLLQHCIHRCRPYFNRRLCLLLLGLGLGVGLVFTPKLLRSVVGIPTPVPSLLLAMDTTYIWALKQDAAIGL